MKQALSAEQLRRTVDPGSLNCQTSAELEANKNIIGQERATRSLKFGLGIRAPGLNI